MPTDPPLRPARRFRRNWIAVASAEHARRGRDEGTPGFMQVCHGKLAPIRRVQPGDRVAYYAPTEHFGGRLKCQRFVSLGVVLPGEPYPYDMGGFVPFRRDVAYVHAAEASIRPLIESLAFTRAGAHWGARFRFGLFHVSDEDMRTIATAMGADTAALEL